MNKKPEKTAENESLRGLNIVRSSLLKSGYGTESPEVKKIDELINKCK